MQTAVANELVQHYSLTGDVDDPVLVFANSLGTDFRIWDDVVGCLPGGLRILRYDLRGHGLTEVTEGPCDLSMLVQDLVSLMDRLEITRCVPVGLSIGGLIAQQLAIDHPERIDGLVLAHTASRIRDVLFWQQRIAALEREGLEAMAEGIIARWFTEAYRAECEVDSLAWRRMLCQTRLTGYLGCCKVLASADLTADISRIGAIDTLVIAGELDTATPPAGSRQLADAIAGSAYVEIVGAAHLSCIERPREFAHHLVQFLARIGHISGVAGRV